MIRTIKRTMAREQMKKFEIEKPNKHFGIGMGHAMERKLQRTKRGRARLAALIKTPQGMGAWRRALVTVK